MIRLIKIYSLEMCRERTLFQNTWIDKTEPFKKKVWKEVQETKICEVGPRDRHRSLS